MTDYSCILEQNLLYLHKSIVQYALIELLEEAEIELREFSKRADFFPESER